MKCDKIPPIDFSIFLCEYGSQNYEKNIFVLFLLTEYLKNGMYELQTGYVRQQLKIRYL